jgi:signal transduction histidine kinase
MEKLQRLISNNEDWLMSRVLSYAQERGYGKYTSTLKEDWRVSISGLSASLLAALLTYKKSPELGPDEDYLNDPIAGFAITEAQKHRERGVPLAMFLGLMKYYRQSYLDLVGHASFAADYDNKCRLFITRFFDRLEIGFCTAWASLTRNKVVEELQNSNLAMTNEKNKYLTILESLADPIIFLDQENRIENVNQAAMQILNKSYMPGSRHHELVRDAPFFENQELEAGAGGSSYFKGVPIITVFPWIKKELDAFVPGGLERKTFDHIFKEQSGTLNYEISLLRMLDVSKKFKGTVVILHDDTHHFQTEVALQRALKDAEHQRKNWQSIFRAAPVGIMLIDQDLNVVQINDVIRREFASLKGRIIGEQPGNALGCIHSVEDPRGCGYGEACKECLIRHTLETVARSREAIRGKEVFRSFIIDGREVPVWLLISAEPVIIDGRDHILVTAEDISERKRVEEMKNEFVSVVSHELRTPLTSITGSLGLLRGGAFGEMPEGVVGLLDIAQRNSERLVRLINDILDIDKIESGNATLKSEPLELMSLVAQAVEANHGFGHKYGVRFEITEVLPSALVMGDHDRLTQVITNLLSNAAKFSPPNQTVKISIAKKQGLIRVSVTNRGKGIPKNFRDRIFEKFAQADYSDSREKGGSGLGLNISRAIIEKHGGSIGFESDSGEDTTFYFDLPELRQKQIGGM